MAPMRAAKVFSPMLAEARDRLIAWLQPRRRFKVTVAPFKLFRAAAMGISTDFSREISVSQAAFRTAGSGL